MGRLLADYQVARIFKVPEEMTVTPCDFFGYTVTGRAILIEAKMVNRGALPIGSSPGLAVHQWAELCDANRANALALICWQRAGIVATIDMDMALELSNKRRSIPWDRIPSRFMHVPSATLELLEPYLKVETFSSSGRSRPS